LSEASAYVLEGIQTKLESAIGKLSLYLRKSRRSISAKKDIQDYNRELSEINSLLEKTNEEYPDDGDLKKISERFYAFNSEKNNLSDEDQKEKLSFILSELKSLAHWRKMETAYGRTLGFSDFRSLRGESKKR
jgi:hypothetical protein